MELPIGLLRGDRMSYPKQKTGHDVVKDMRRFTRTAKRSKKINVAPKIPRGGIRL